MSTTNTSSPARQALLRPWSSRMHADHGWLKTFLTFSFAGQYDPLWTSFGPLRVVNEDRIEPRTGFPTHRHAAFEIFSYVLGGELSHRDSMRAGHQETLTKGSVQYTRAGTGIAHSEYNLSPSGLTHFMQIWFRPRKDFRAVEPRYFSFGALGEAKKRDGIVTLIRPSEEIMGRKYAKGQKEGGEEEEEPIPAHESIVVRASILAKKGVAVTHRWGEESDVEGDAGAERWGLVHLAMRSGYKDPTDPPKATAPGEASVKVTLPSGAAAVETRSSKGQLVSKAGEQTEWVLNEGDAVFFKGMKVGEEVKVERLNDDGGQEAEFLLFDLRAGRPGEEDDY